jgi:hypothetical protein
LWRKMCFVAPLFRIPWIIDAWLPSSEKMWQPGRINWWNSFLEFIFYNCFCTS